jgi:hypothetical protein
MSKKFGHRGQGDQGNDYSEGEPPAGHPPAGRLEAHPGASLIAQPLRRHDDLELAGYFPIKAELGREPAG